MARRLSFQRPGQAVRAGTSVCPRAFHHASFCLACPDRKTSEAEKKLVFPLDLCYREFTKSVISTVEDRLKGTEVNGERHVLCTALGYGAKSILVSTLWQFRRSLGRRVLRVNVHTSGSSATPFSTRDGAAFSSDQGLGNYTVRSTCAAKHLADFPSAGEKHAQDYGPPGSRAREALPQGLRPVVVANPSGGNCSVVWGATEGETAWP